MTSYLNDQTYTQTFGDQNLTADPANPTVVFLNATSIVAFAGNGGVGTEYIVLGAVSQSPLLYKFDAFAPGDIVHFHIDFQGAVNYVINSSSNIVWTSGGPAWHGSDTTPIDGDIIFGSENVSFSFAGQGFQSNTNFAYSMTLDRVGHDSNSADFGHASSNRPTESGGGTSSSNTGDLGFTSGSPNSPAAPFVPGGNVTVGYSLTSSFSVAQTIHAQFFISSDFVISTADTPNPDSPDLGAVLTIAANSTLKGTAVIALPSNLPPGTYYVGTVLDPLNELSETNEANNASAGMQITVVAPASGVTMTGGAAADTLIGNTGPDQIDGGGGNDSLSGDAGNDVIFGGAGDDSINGGPGNDTILGQDGNDMIAGDSGADHINGGNGNDVIFGGGGPDEIGGGSGDDTIVGNDGSDVIFGEDGNDQANGGAGADTMIGGAGNDTFGGGADNDVIVGGDGADLLFGEDGVDNINGGLGDDGVVGGTGNDILGGGDGNDIVVGDDGNDVLFGEAGNDAMNGGFGNDTLIGSDGDDVLGGGAGNDDINGGFGNDTLFGENGNDILNGSAGNDILIGGGNDDTFVFQPGDGADTIGDFFAGGPEDRIWFKGTDLHSFADVQAHATTVAGNTVITYNGFFTVTLNGVTGAQVTAGDFIFT